MTWKQLSTVALAALATLIFLFGLVNTLVWLLPGADELWHIEFLMAATRPLAGTASLVTPAAMKKLFIAIQLMMSFVLAALPALVAWILERTQRKRQQAEIDEENGRAEWGDQALSWWLGQLLESAGDSQSREEMIRKGISQFFPALAPGHQTWMREVVVGLGLRTESLPEPLRQEKEWQLKEPFTTVLMLGSGAMSIFVFLLGILNAIGLAWMGGYPGLDLPANPASITMTLGEFTSLAAAFGVFALGIFRGRKSALLQVENVETQRRTYLEKLAETLPDRLGTLSRRWSALADAVTNATLKVLTGPPRKRLLGRLQEAGFKVDGKDLQ